MQTIKSSNYKTVLAKNFDVLVDTAPNDPVMALMVEPVSGKKFILPMDLKSARDMAVMMLDTLMKVSPLLVMEVLNS
jgi:hypothetical protein